MDFEPKLGHYLAYPDKNSINILNTSDWSKKCTLTCDSVDSEYSIVKYSPCGKYISAASIKGDLIVWDVRRSIAIATTTHPKLISICSMAWNPSGMVINYD